MFINAYVKTISTNNLLRISPTLQIEDKAKRDVAMNTELYANTHPKSMKLLIVGEESFTIL